MMQGNSESVTYRNSVVRRSTGLPLIFALLAMASISPVFAQTAPAVAPAAPSAANLNINPKRVTFDRPGKSATISVFNQGNSEGGFDVELIDRVMTPDGQIVPVSDVATKPEIKPIVDRLKSAKAMVVVTPRRIRIAANSGQAIRVRVAATADMAPGEYRTHLTVTGIPPADIGLTAEDAAAQKEGQLSFRVNSVLGISIPVIVRVGPVDVRAAIENPAIRFENISSDGRATPVRTAVLAFELVRLGANSLFGDLEVRGARERGSGQPLGAVRGIGVYPEIDRRVVKIALQRVPAAGERLDIQFRDDDTAPGSVLSKASLTVP
jgi:hypothetical protein